MIARPRYRTGGREEVVGYSVALRSDDSGPVVWYGGGKLGRDLTLSKLRQQWTGADPTEAVSAWSERGVRRGRMTNPLLRDEAAWEMAAQQIQHMREQLKAVPVDDVVRWSQAAYEASGVLAVLSARMEGERPGPLARASDVLARSAQRTRDCRSAPLTVEPGQLRGAAMAAHYSRSSVAGQVAFVMALRNTLRGIHAMHEARDERDQALRIEGVARGDLQRWQQSRAAMQDSPGALPLPGIEQGRGPGPHGPDRGAENGR